MLMDSKQRAGHQQKPNQGRTKTWASYAFKHFKRATVQRNVRVSWFYIAGLHVIIRGMIL